MLLKFLNDSIARAASNDYIFATVVIGSFIGVIVYMRKKHQAEINEKVYRNSIDAKLEKLLGNESTLGQLKVQSDEISQALDKLRKSFHKLLGIKQVEVFFRGSIIQKFQAQKEHNGYVTHCLVQLYNMFKLDNEDLMNEIKRVRLLERNYPVKHDYIQSPDPSLQDIVKTIEEAMSKLEFSDEDVVP